MPVVPDGNLHVYVLNVGQADTCVIVTPRGQVIVIDAARPRKLVRFLTHLGLPAHGEIDLLLISHPHSDHFAGANRLVREFHVKKAILTPFWHTFGMGPPTYCNLVAQLHVRGAVCDFLSGYSRWYPESPFGHSHSRYQKIDPDAPYLELFGPTNSLVASLERQGVFDTNHLSVMSRFTWRDFRMILAADAQMENWGPFDAEQLLTDKCQVLKAAHHGSGNGTQWERISRLSPQVVIVSSDPTHRHNLPDVVGAVTFAKYASPRNRAASSVRVVAITEDTGTVRITVTRSGTHRVESFGDRIHQMVNLTAPTLLDYRSNRTDWKLLAGNRLASL